jgi:hypothetical protein
MASVASQFAEIASTNLQIATAEITATGDPETILWALDQIRQADACLKLVMAECDRPSDEG